jgi:hypothetical protein
MTTILELFYAAYAGSILKETLGISHSNSTVAIIGLKDGFFEAEVVTADLAGQSIAMQQRFSPLFCPKSRFKQLSVYKEIVI